MTDRIDIDALRHIGMRLVCALVGGLAAITVIATLLIDAPGKWPAAVLAVAIAIYPLVCVLGRRIDAAARMAVSVSVVAMPALLLFVSEGHSWQTDLHMLFFALLAAASVLCDWKALLAATAVVAVHHVGVDLINSAWLFAGTGSFARVLLHATILAVEAGTLMWVAQRIVALIDASDVQTHERETAAAALLAERSGQAAVVATVTVALGTALTALASGDLTDEITADFPDDFAVLKRDYNVALTGLQTMIATVATSSEAIRTGSNEIAAASDDLARRTESNAASLEQTSAALVQIDQRVRTTTAASLTTAARADQATATVQVGRDTAEGAMRAMERVSGSAQGIDSVIEGLDKIAFQTRVLAMNAAVEAGRAGDAGRGFAVVADLVSALAMRAEEEAKRARDQLTVTQSEIVSAVAAVEKVDGALAAIAGDVGAVQALIAGMAVDNQAQSGAITEITAAVGSMDRATQQNAAMVEQTSAAARQLTAEVSALADSAAAFRFEGRPANAPVAVERPSRRPTVMTPKRHVPAPRQAATTVAAALNGHGSAGQAGWADF